MAVVYKIHIEARICFYLRLAFPDMTERENRFKFHNQRVG